MLDLKQEKIHVKSSKYIDFRLKHLMSVLTDSKMLPGKVVPNRSALFFSTSIFVFTSPPILLAAVGKPNLAALASFFASFDIATPNFAALLSSLWQKKIEIYNFYSKY